MLQGRQATLVGGVGDDSALSEVWEWVIEDRRVSWERAGSDGG